MNIEVVIGANYGDEGKGLVTDYLCLKNPKSIVVLNNGGCQRGHTVEFKDGTRHVFHHFGSGTLRNIPSYFTYSYYLNPIEFIREYQEISRLVPGPIISYHHPNCILQLPSDIAMNWFIERERDKRGFRHGSVGCGIWETAKRVDNRNAISFDDFCKMSYLEKVNHINYIAQLQRETIGNRKVELFDIFMSQGFIDHFIADCMEMSRLCQSVDSNILENYETLIFENGQGLMLDEMFSNDIVHSTPSHTGSLGVAEFLNSSLDFNIENMILNYVTRPYITRHGAGDFEGNTNSNMIFIDDTNIENEWQGKIRYGTLDIMSLNSRISKDTSMFKYSCKSNYVKFDSKIFMTHCNESTFSDKLYCDYMSYTKFSDDIQIREYSAYEK